VSLRISRSIYEKWPVADRVFLDITDAPTEHAVRATPGRAN
jgi:hypothetical protein